MFSQTSKDLDLLKCRKRLKHRKALAALNTFEFKGKKIIVNEARPQKERGGGGGRRR